MSILLNSKNFNSELEKAELPFLVDFYADWCQPCKQMAPFVDEIEVENKGKLILAKINVDESVEIVQKYGVQSIPTLILFDKNKTPVKQITGFQSKQSLVEQLDEYIKSK